MVCTMGALTGGHLENRRLVGNKIDAKVGNGHNVTRNMPTKYLFPVQKSQWWNEGRWST